MITPLASNLVHSAANRSPQAALQRPAAGKRVRSTADGAASQAAPAEAATQQKGKPQAGGSMDVLALADTAGGALGQTNDSMQRMREVAVQASNGAYGAGGLKSLQTQVDQSSPGILQAVVGTRFNVRPLMGAAGHANASQDVPRNPTSTQAVALYNAVQQTTQVPLKKSP